MHLSNITIKTVITLKTQIEQILEQCRSLEEAAQTFTNLLFEEFEESLVLMRFFATIPYNELPPAYQSVVNILVNPEQSAPVLRKDTPVLTLLGTRGGEEDLRNTRHAFGIPLASTDFVESIPIVSQLLQEIGFDLNWKKKQRNLIQELDVETDSTGFMAGMLYVPDAQHAVNGNGAKLLHMVDQLPLYSLESVSDVNTIFGIGGAYIHGPFIAAIFFSREQLEKTQVELLMPLANYFKTSTLKLVIHNKLFT